MAMEEVWVPTAVTIIVVIVGNISQYAFFRGAFVEWKKAISSDVVDLKRDIASKKSKEECVHDREHCQAQIEKDVDEFRTDIKTLNTRLLNGAIQKG